MVEAVGTAVSAVLAEMAARVETVVLAVVVPAGQSNFWAA
jgi:hypothetical protein